MYERKTWNGMQVQVICKTDTFGMIIMILGLTLVTPITLRPNESDSSVVVT